MTDAAESGPAGGSLARLIHDVRTPLTTIQVAAEMLLDDPDLTESQETEAREILGALQRLKKLLDARLAAG
ncbi:MAG: hypothetical protein H7338_09925 [Candidatus Sericytochromatia bacterium]|nr:hypothetical protein [Candidatus Sericytochromatia bacterium]